MKESYPNLTPTYDPFVAREFLDRIYHTPDSITPLNPYDFRHPISHRISLTLDSPSPVQSIYPQRLEDLLRSLQLPGSINLLPTPSHRDELPPATLKKRGHEHQITLYFTSQDKESAVVELNQSLHKLVFTYHLNHLEQYLDRRPESISDMVPDWRRRPYHTLLTIFLTSSGISFGLGLVDAPIYAALLPAFISGCGLKLARDSHRHKIASDRYHYLSILYRELHNQSNQPLQYFL